MKRLILFALALLTSASTMAAPGTIKTATLVIRGTIIESCLLTVSGTSNTQNLNLIVPQNGILVGNIATRCNNLNGYSLSVDTANASKLTSLDGTPPVPYTINFVKTQGNAINSGGYFPSDSNNLDISPIVDTTDQRANILLNTVSGTPYAGTYTDTMTFTLTTL